MSDKSRIEWTDATWNPTRGCTKVSSGCDNCYAETLVNGRLRHQHPGGFEKVMLLPDRLDQPLRWTRPRRIFVNSLSDLFHSAIPDEYIARVFAVMALTPQHTYQILTKRHARMRALLQEPVRHFGDSPGNWFSAKMFRQIIDLVGYEEMLDRWPDPRVWPLPNVWLGVSVEDQKLADIRIPVLLDTPAAVRFLSCEPLLGPVELDQWTCPCEGRRWVDDEGWSPDSREVWEQGRSPDEGRIPCGLCNHGGWNEDDIERPGIDWVIVGGESGRNARPMHPDWARSIRDQCLAAGVPFLFKQWGEWAPSLGRVPAQELMWPDGSHRPDTGPPYTPAGWTNIERVGKKAAGRELHGHTWDEYPDA